MSRFSLTRVTRVTFKRWHRTFVGSFDSEGICRNLAVVDVPRSSAFAKFHPQYVNLQMGVDFCGTAQ